MTYAQHYRALRAPRDTSGQFVIGSPQFSTDTYTRTVQQIAVIVGLPERYDEDCVVRGGYGRFPTVEPHPAPADITPGGYTVTFNRAAYAVTVRRVYFKGGWYRVEFTLDEFPGGAEITLTAAQFRQLKPERETPMPDNKTLELTVEEIATLDADAKQAAIASLDAAMIEQGRALKAMRDEAEKVVAEYDAAYEAFKRQHEDLIARKNRLVNETDRLKARLQTAATTRYLVTGTKTWTAFQTAESSCIDYDTAAMLGWILTEAPGDWRRKFLKLDTVQLDKALRERLDDFGAIKPPEGAASVPAVGRTVYVGKVTMHLLDALPEPEPPAAPVEQPKSDEIPDEKEADAIPF